MSSKWLARLNAVAMPSSLAALTASSLSWMRTPALVVALPTFFSALLWLRIFRRNKKVRTALILSVPVAMLNAALASGFSFAVSTNSQTFLEGFFMGAVIGPLVGVVIWLPALVLVLFFYGIPLIRAHRLAERGLAGAERGERIVGAVSAALTVLVWVIPYATDRNFAATRTLSSNFVGVEPLVFALALLAAVTGALCTVLATLRARERSEFVRRVADGAVAGFRLEQTEHGKALTRVTSFGEGYRVTDLHEELCRLDDDGEVREPLRAER